ncbi:hypothetical protein SOV_35970 [Sporomusa ovata DSM 2662]|uniref:Uncharacterized protein n=1 Tax=Sporomusa ovata TaxID=2378 RepID=A0A0U1L874_9FIRM|nr:hypothetical protein [Sporomusa ovata]EQB24746.1 hypothetical protein SOV_6c01600 [Sporomusa ovata DSM 2662]CQR75094.1 hypothetical protein SpAn4DRAFT_4458 [Sporomusa ovata]
MNCKAKVVNQEIQEEMIGMLTAISIVSKRLASKLLQLSEQKLEEKGTPAHINEGGNN